MTPDQLEKLQAHSKKKIEEILSEYLYEHRDEYEESLEKIPYDEFMCEVVHYLNSKKWGGEYKWFKEEVFEYQPIVFWHHISILTGIDTSGKIESEESDYRCGC